MAGLVPHSAFDNPSADKDVLPRKSIEVQVVAVSRRE